MMANIACIIEEHEGKGGKKKKNLIKDNVFQFAGTGHTNLRGIFLKMYHNWIRSLFLFFFLGSIADVVVRPQVWCSCKYIYEIVLLGASLCVNREIICNNNNNNKATSLVWHGIIHQQQQQQQLAEMWIFLGCIDKINATWAWLLNV